MTLDELILQYREEMNRAQAIEATAPVAKVLERVIDDLGAVGPGTDPRSFLRIAKVAALEDVSEETVRRRCRRGYYTGAEKTSGATGDWRIPTSALGPRPKRPGRRRLRP